MPQTIRSVRAETTPALSIAVFAAVVGALIPGPLASSGLAPPGEFIPAQPDSVRILPWPGSALGAVSITFDDAYASHVEIAAPLLETHGFRGTFYLIVNRLLGQGKYSTTTPTASIADWQAVAARDHEIGSHTSSHVSLDSIAAGFGELQLRGSKAALQRLFRGSRIESLAYPFAQANAQVVGSARAFYTTGRLGPAANGEPQHNDPHSVDLLQLKSMFLCSDDTVDQWNGAVDSTLAAGGWLVESIHPINEVGYCRIYRRPFAAHLHYMAELGDRVWVSPVGKVAERLHLWRHTEIDVQRRSDDRLELTMHGPGDGSITWRVVVTLGNSGEWHAVDAMGTALPTVRSGNSLTIKWPGDVDTVFLRDSEHEKAPTRPLPFELTYAGQPYEPMTFIVIDATVDGEPLEAGDEIAIMDGIKVVGHVSLDKRVQLLPVRASTATPDAEDGFVAGNPVSFRIWDASAGREVTHVTANWIDPDSGRSLPETTFVSRGKVAVALVASFHAMPKASVSVKPDGASRYEPVYDGRPVSPMSLFVIAASVDGTPLEAGDELAALDRGNVVGHAVGETGMMFVTISASTAAEGRENGFVAGNPISFLIWDSSAGREIADVTVQWMDPATGTAIPDPPFASHGQVALALEGRSQPCEGDYDGNRIVNYQDFFAFVARFGTGSEEHHYDPSYDLHRDGAVDYFDLFRFADLLGTQCID